MNIRTVFNKTWKAVQFVSRLGQFLRFKLEILSLAQ